MKIAIQFAMAGEAAPFLASGGFTEVAPDATYGFRFYERPGVVVGVSGTHPRFNVDAIGTVPATLLTHELITRFKPSRLINAGTAGGFEAKGGAIGDVYLGADVAVFHDRRIPLGAFEAMGRGHFPIESNAALARKLGCKIGIVSTGDSLDCTPEDAKRMAELDASVKDMEAAGIAWVCERHWMPLVLLKVITDLVDHHTSTAEQFTQNYSLAVTRLESALRVVVEHYAALP